LTSGPDFYNFSGHSPFLQADIPDITHDTGET
jgi:hypothetical protein